MKQINIRDTRVASAFFGKATKIKHATVTSIDFDEEDNWAPGTYDWIDVDDDAADRWNAGLDACKARGVNARSREGLLLRYRIMHEDDSLSLPPGLSKVADEYEERVAAEQAAAAARKARRDTIAALLVGRHEISLSHGHADVNDLMRESLLERGVSHPVHPNTDGLPLVAVDDSRQDTFHFYKLPNGDILRTCPGMATDLWTTDSEYAAAWRKAAETVGVSDYYTRFYQRTAAQADETHPFIPR